MIDVILNWDVESFSFDLPNQLPSQPESPFANSRHSFKFARLASLAQAW